ncbi:IS110 family transposase [Weissella minor]|uniref:IS110 family transposase n=1 Tax=Weissella minor TaxID=1620 RepID=UPI001BB036F6|nr:IS110 family transposase [Weissella minor]MBS0949804.1 IS110 family transposase [Weissella minor]
MVERLAMGIDVGKQYLFYCLLSNDGEIVEQGKVENTQDGFELLSSFVAQNKAEIIFEATGVYSSRLQYFFELNHFSYVRINPLQAKKEMDTLRNTKNDKVDARKLALLQLQKSFQPTAIEDEVYRELRRRSRFYSEMTQECANAKNRVQRLLEETFYTLPSVSNKDTLRFYEIAAVLPHVDYVKSKDSSELLQMLKGISGYDKPKIKLIARLQEISHHTAVAVNKDSWAVEELQYWANKVLELTALKEKIISDMVHMAEPLSELQILESIPGIAKSTAVTLIAEIGDIRRFNTPQKLNAYIGIDLRFSDSGQLKTSGFISKRGNSEARKELYQIFLQIIMADKQNELELTKWYKRRTKDMEYGKKKIIIGGMDRSLRLIHHLVMNEETFDKQQQLL